MALGPGMAGKPLAEPAAVGVGSSVPPLPRPPPTSGAVWVRRLGASCRNDSEDEARLWERERGPEMGSPGRGSCLESPQAFSELWARVASARSRDREGEQAGRHQGKGLEAAPGETAGRPFPPAGGASGGRGVHRPGQGGVTLGLLGPQVGLRVGQD